MRTASCNWIEVSGTKQWRPSMPRISLLLSVGAEPFASRVESDLKRAGARSTRRSARSSLELTDRERDVAVLVAKGYSNPEAAVGALCEPEGNRVSPSEHLRKARHRSRRELRGLDLLGCPVRSSIVPPPKWQ